MKKYTHKTTIASAVVVREVKFKDDDSIINHSILDGEKVIFVIARHVEGLIYDVNIIKEFAENTTMTDSEILQSLIDEYNFSLFGNIDKYKIAEDVNVCTTF